MTLHTLFTCLFIWIGLYILSHGKRKLLNTNKMNITFIFAVMDNNVDVGYTNNNIIYREQKEG